jgi:ABC-2 type transport system permease protein
MGHNLDLSLRRVPELALIMLLVALLSAAGGLTIGCTGDLTRAGLLFTLVIGPLIMFGCTYYTWASLAKFSILQKLVLLDPLVYASEGLRATLAPQIPHLSLIIIMIALLVIDASLVAIGLYRFYRKAIG